MTPGDRRSQTADDNAVGRHVPPSSGRVAAFMAAFEDRYQLEPLVTASRVFAIPAAHHRLTDG